jgi:hypothetical protein
LTVFCPITMWSLFDNFDIVCWLRGLRLVLAHI